MKEIIFVRHATAEEPGNFDDLSRKLVSNGVYESENVAFLLKKLQKKVDLILTSNASRSLETADAIQRIAFNSADRKVDDLLYSGKKNDYLQSVKKLKEKYNSVLIIGHNPVIKEVAAYFLDADLGNVCFPKASVYSFRVDCDKWSAVNNKYSELTLFIRREHIEKITCNSGHKKKRDLIDSHYEKTLSLIASIKKEGFQTGTTHDLRVINRKWLSIINFSLLKEEALTTIINEFMRTTGKYRDICVQTKILKRENKGQNIYRFWKKKRNKKKEMLFKEMNSLFKKNTQTCYERLYRELCDGRVIIQKDKLMQNIQQSIEQLKLKRGISMEQDGMQLHKFRLKIKDVRYKMEFYNAFYEECGYDLDKIIFLHKNLGQIRDYQKLIKKIEEKKAQCVPGEVEETILCMENKLQENWKEFTKFLEENDSFYL